MTEPQTPAMTLRPTSISYEPEKMDREVLKKINQLHYKYTNSQLHKPQWTRHHNNQAIHRAIVSQPRTVMELLRAKGVKNVLTMDPSETLNFLYALRSNRPTSQPQLKYSNPSNPNDPNNPVHPNNIATNLQNNPAMNPMFQADEANEAAILEQQNLKQAENLQISNQQNEEIIQAQDMITEKPENMPKNHPHPIKLKEEDIEKIHALRETVKEHTLTPKTEEKIVGKMIEAIDKGDKHLFIQAAAGTILHKEEKHHEEKNTFCTL